MLFEKFIDSLSNNKSAITSLGIIATFIISSISLYYTRRNNKAVHYVNTITKNRVDWIYKLRDYVAEYISLVTLDNHTSFIHDEDLLSDHFHKIKLVQNKIRLLLNYTGELDRRIIKNINEIENLSVKFYGMLSLMEKITDESLTDDEIDSMMAGDIYAREYVVEYLQSQNYNYNCDIYGLGFFCMLKHDISDLRAKNLLNGWDGGIAFACDSAVKQINKKIDNLIQDVQVYLKFEWNRVKYEGKGDKYPSRLQKFDLLELQELQSNNNYKKKTVKRFLIKHFGVKF